MNIIHESVAGDFLLRVGYRSNLKPLRVEVTHMPTQCWRAKDYKFLYEPVFGLDVADLHEIELIGEELCVELEVLLGILDV